MPWGPDFPNQDLNTSQETCDIFSLECGFRLNDSDPKEIHVYLSTITNCFDYLNQCRKVVENKTEKSLNICKYDSQ